MRDLRARWETLRYCARLRGPSASSSSFGILESPSASGSSDVRPPGWTFSDGLATRQASQQTLRKKLYRIRQIAITTIGISGIGINFILLGCGKGGSYSQNQLSARPNEVPTPIPTPTGDRYAVDFEPINNPPSLCNNQAAQYFRFSVVFAAKDNSGLNAAIPITGISFNVDGRITADLPFIIDGINPAISGTFVRVTGSDINGNVGPNYAHWESNESLTIPPNTTNALVFTVDFSNVMDPSNAGTGSPIVITLKLKYDPSFTLISGGQSLFQTVLNFFNNC